MYFGACRSIFHPLVEDAEGCFSFRIDHFRHEPSGFRSGRRVSVRAVAWELKTGSSLPGDIRLLLVHSAKLGDYKFPGGGMEPGEDVAAALDRELREEAGHVLEGQPILMGTVEECWYEPGESQPGFILESRYYHATLGSERCALCLDDYEADLGFEPVWQSAAAAIAAHEILMASPPAGLRSWIQRETRVLRWLAARTKPQPAGDVPAAKPAIGFDIDGVLVDTIRHSAEFLSVHSGRSISEWDIIHDFDKVPELDRLFDTLGPELLAALPPYGGVAGILAGIAGQARVHLVSARSECNRALTEEWLLTHGIPCQELILTGGGGKRDLCRQREIGLFVEDSPYNAGALAEAGIPVLLLDKAYNRDFRHPGVRRCADWVELGQAVRLWLASRPARLQSDVPAPALPEALAFELSLERSGQAEGARFTDGRRQAARAVARDGDLILLLAMRASGGWAFPGGGVEPGEDRLQALARELVEETGYRLVAAGPAIGKITENIRVKPGQGRDLVMESWYHPCLVGEVPGPAAHSPKELAQGVEARWVPLNQALTENLALFKTMGHDAPPWLARETRALQELRIIETSGDMHGRQ